MYQGSLTFVVCCETTICLRVHIHARKQRVKTWILPSSGLLRWEWRRLNNEKLYALYSSPNIIWVIKSRRVRRAGHVARMGTWKGEYRVYMGKAEERRPFGMPRRSWEDNIKTDIRDVRWGAWIGGQWSFGFHQIRGTSWLAEDLLIFQEDLHRVH
jgi:hypothetical protein